MHRARMTQSTIPQAADERKIIIPGREIECRIERAAERGERLFGAVRTSIARAQDIRPWLAAERLL